MRPALQTYSTRAAAQANELLDAIEAAESVIVATIERECEALRAGRMLAAKALHTRLCDAARLYLDATRAARASLWTMEQILPGIRDRMEERRAAFSDLLKVELAVLAAERAALEGCHAPDIAGDLARYPSAAQSRLQPRRSTSGGAAASCQDAAPGVFSRLFARRASR